MTEMQAGDLRRELLLARSLYESHEAAQPDSVADWLGSIADRRVTLIAPDGRVIGDSEVPDAGLGALENHGGRPEIREALKGRMGRAVRLSTSVGNREMYMAVPASEGRVIRLAVPLDEVYATVRRVQRGIFSVGVVALVLTGLLSFGFSIAVTRPLRQLAGVARAMAAGDLTRRARTPNRDEVGELADALDTLAGELQRRLGQLEGERAEMQALIDAMDEAVIAVDARGRVRRANPAARRIFSLTGDPRGLQLEEGVAVFRQLRPEIALRGPPATLPLPRRTACGRRGWPSSWPRRARPSGSAMSGSSPTSPASTAEGPSWPSTCCASPR